MHVALAIIARNISTCMREDQALLNGWFRSRKFPHPAFSFFSQALVSDGAEFVWLPSSDGAVPCGAIQGGTCESGERLYIGRTFHNNTITIGKVHPSHRCLYIPYGGKEHSYDEYEVLVCKTVDF